MAGRGETAPPERADDHGDDPAVSLGRVSGGGFAVASLPIAVPLVRAESHSSLVTRLASANHVPIEDMRQLLAWSPGGRAADLSRMASLTGHPVEHVKQVLSVRTPRRPCELRLACRRCMARRGIHQPVEIHTATHQYVCSCHRRWLAPVHALGTQEYSLGGLPEVIAAHRRHLRLIRRHRRCGERLFDDARHILFRWTERRDWPEHRESRLGRLGEDGYWLFEHHPLITLINYPETVALAELLAGWSASPTEDIADVRDRLAAEVRRRLRIGYAPYHGWDPLLRWADQQRQEQLAQAGTQAAAPYASVCAARLHGASGSARVSSMT